MSSLENDLYELMISDAKERYYINEAEKPAWIILDKYSILTSQKSCFQLWFDTMHCWRFRRLSECHDKIREMVQKAKVPMKVWRKTKRDERVLFAVKE